MIEKLFHLLQEPLLKHHCEQQSKGPRLILLQTIFQIVDPI